MWACGLFRQICFGFWANSFCKGLVYIKIYITPNQSAITILASELV